MIRPPVIFNGYSIFLILLITTTTLINFGKGDIGPFTYPGNGHNYTRKDLGSMQDYEAASKCRDMNIFNPYSNYLATFTTKDEFDWAISVGLINAQPTYISGKLDNYNGLKFNTGPENGQLIYDYGSGRPYSFFHSFPDLSSQYGIQRQLYAVSNGTVSFQSISGTPSALSSVICEFGGTTDPILSGLDAGVVNGVIKVTGLTGYNISALTMTFTSRNTADPSPAFTCISITWDSTTAASCTVPPGTGSYNVLITDGKKISNVVWSFNPPYLKSIVPYYGPGGSITLYGGSFGLNASKIQVYVTVNMIPCPFESILLLGKAFTVSGVTLDSQFLPITIVVDQVYSRLNLVPVWDGGSYSFLYPLAITNGFIFYSNVISACANADEGIPAQFGFIENALTAINMNATYPNFYDTTDRWMVWEDLRFNNFPPSFQRFTTGQTVIPYNISYVDPTGFPITGFIYFDPATNLIYSDTTKNFRFFIQYIPAVSLASGSSITVDTTGITNFQLNLTSYGARWVGSQSFYMNGNLLTIANYDPRNNYGNVSFDIPPGFNSIPFAVKTDNRYYNTTIQYNKPNITSANTAPTQGGEITIQGFNFFTSNTNVVVTVVGKTCSNPNIITPHNTITCTVPAGVGSGSLTVRVGTQTSAAFPWQYQSPIITNLDKSGNPALLDIMGVNFGNTVSAARVLVSSSNQQNVQCTNTTLPTPNTRVTAIVPPFMQGRTVEVKVRISTILSNNSLFIDLEPYLSNPLTLPFTEGGIIELLTYFDTVTKNGTAITSVNLLINGTSTSSPCQVKNLVPPTGVILLCEVPAGYYTFTANLDTPWGKSNPLTISYSPPAIESASPVKYLEGGLVTVKGNSFGDLSLPLSVLIGNFTNMVNCTGARVLDPYHIECHYNGTVPAPADKTRSLNVSVTTTFGSATREVFIYTLVLSCPNNCSGHGTCNTDTGNCLCDQGYRSSSDCSNPDNNGGGKPETNENGTTTIPVEGLNFTISITHLRELDIDGNTVKTLPLSDVEWLTEKLDDTMVHNGNFSYDSALITIVSTYFGNSTTITFAGQEMVLPSNSIKYEITVSNWNWTNTLSQLQVIYSSVTDQQSTVGCDQVSKTNITTSSDGENIYWFQIKSGNSVMNAKFANRLIVDDRVIGANVKLLDSSDELYKNLSSSSSTDKFNVLTAMTTPYFTNQVILDPSFSALLQYRDNTDNDQCNNNSTMEKWKIIVIAVCGGIGLLTAASASALLIKKWRMESGAKKKLNRLARMNAYDRDL